MRGRPRMNDQTAPRGSNTGCAQGYEKIVPCLPEMGLDDIRCLAIPDIDPDNRIKPVEVDRRMATQVPRELCIGNFKASKTEAALERRAELNEVARKDRDGNDELHLGAIRKLPCCIPGCTVVGSDPHHLKCVPGTRGMGLRAPDRYTLPLCRGHHDDVEAAGSRNEVKWFAKHGITDPVGLADALFGVPKIGSKPDAAKMVRIVLASKAAALEFLSVEGVKSHEEKKPSRP